MRIVCKHRGWPVSCTAKANAVAAAGGKHLVPSLVGTLVPCCRLYSTYSCARHSFATGDGARSHEAVQVNESTKRPGNIFLRRWQQRCVLGRALSPGETSATRTRGNPGMLMRGKGVVSSFPAKQLKITGEMKQSVIMIHALGSSPLVKNTRRKLHTYSYGALKPRCKPD